MSILARTRWSLTFLGLRNATIGRSPNIYFSSSTDSIVFQYFLMMLTTFGPSGWYVIAKGTRSFLRFVLYLRTVSLSIALVSAKSFSIRLVLYPCLWRWPLSSSSLLSHAVFLEQIRLIRIDKPFGRFLTKWRGWLLLGRKYWCESIVLQWISISIDPFSMVAFVSRNVLVVSEMLAVNLMDGWNEFANSKKSSRCSRVSVH